MYKRVEFAARDPQGNPLVELIRYSDGGLEKISSVIVPEVEQFIHSLKPQAGKTAVLVNALGSGEFWSSNINGDWFPWDSLVYEPPGWDKVRYADLETKRKFAWNYCAAKGYGYTTFYGAHPFVHHVNYDFFSKVNRVPKPRMLGEVILAVPNPQMRRVELVVLVDHELAQQHGGAPFLSRIENGDYPDVSMGTKVPFDICSICGNVAKTRAEYCDHLKFHMNDIDPATGKKTFAINTKPRFFDISFVLLGADKTGKTMGKVASVGGRFWTGVDLAEEYCDHIILPQVEELEKAAAAGQPSILGHHAKPTVEKILGNPGRTQKFLKAVREKTAELRKRGIIDKPSPDSPEQVLNRKLIPALSAQEPDLPSPVLKALGSSPQGLSTAGLLGVVLRPREFQRVYLDQAGGSEVADALERDGRVFRPVPYSDHRACPTSLLSAGMDPSIRDLLLPLLAQRSAMQPLVKRRVVRITIVGPPQLQEGEPTADPMLDKVSAAYNAYRQNLMKVAQWWPGVLENDPKVAEAVWGDELMTLFAGGPTQKLGSVPNLEQMCYLGSAFGWGRAGEAEPVSRMASGMDT